MTKFFKNKNRPLCKIFRVKNDSPTDFIYFKIKKLFYCKISILLLTNFIPINLCLAILQNKI